MPKQTNRDKYGFKSLQIGDIKFVTGVNKKHAQMMAAQYCRRYPEMVNRDFVWTSVNGGVRVERVR